MPNASCFTLKSTGRLYRLPSDALILSSAREPNTSYTPKMWSAIWDTGATKSCITQRVVDDLHLISVGQTEMGTASGTATVDTYYVDIGLPNRIIIPNILVSCANLGRDLDVLIGMDIISLGDFAITNVGGKTTFSFRFPSVSEIDFIKDSKNLTI